MNSYHSPFWTLSSIWLPLYSPQTMWMCLMPLCLVLPLSWVPMSRFTLRYVHSSVQLSHSVLSDSLQPCGLQHTRLPYPSPTPGACSNACPLSQWCHPSISSSAVPFSSCLQSFPASGSFLESVLHIRWPKYWTFIFSISPSNNYSGLISFRIDWFDLRAVQVFKSISSLALSLLYGPTLTSVHDYWKNCSFDYMDLCRQSNVSAF